MFIDPTPDQVTTFAGSGQPGPVFMLNLLRFKDEVDDEGLSGAEVYARYAAVAAQHVARVGGEIVWSGACGTALIGPDDPEWHIAAVVRYPSREAFLQMVADADYLEASKDRTASLEDSRLIPCVAAG